jgi:hypothetical protein
MTVLRWAFVGSLDDPVFLVATVLFLLGMVPVALRARSLFSAGELGALYGYVYGVIVWGMIGYAYGFDGQLKLIFAGCAILDAVVICVILRAVLPRDTSERTPHAGSSRA